MELKRMKPAVKRWMIRGLLVLGALLAVSVGFVLIVLAIWDADFDGYVKRLQSQGQPVHCLELVPSEIPDDKNAAKVYAKAFTILETLEGPVSESARDTDPPEGRQDLARYVGARAGALSHLMDAVRIPQCRFPYDYKRGNQVSSTHHRHLLRAARTLEAAARLAAMEGKGTEFLKYLMAAMTLVRSVEEDPILLSQLVRYAIVSVLFDGFAPDRLDLSSAEWGHLGDTFRDTSLRPGLFTAFKFERACAIMVTRGELPVDDAYAIPWWGWPLIRKAVMNYLVSFEDVISCGSLPAHEARIKMHRLARDADAKRGIASFLSAGLVPIMASSHDALLKCEGRLRVMEAVCRLKAKKGDEAHVRILDPSSGVPLRSILEDNGLLIYSIGPNGIDESGVEDEQTGMDDIAIRIAR